MDFLVVNHLKVRVNNIIHFPNAFKKNKNLSSTKKPKIEKRKKKDKSRITNSFNINGNKY
jgi:hypothetical protein